MQRYFEIDIKLSDGSESKKLPFDRIGTIADLVREIRRELNIAPEEKVEFAFFLFLFQLNELLLPLCQIPPQ